MFPSHREAHTQESNYGMITQKSKLAEQIPQKRTASLQICPETICLNHQASYLFLETHTECTNYERKYHYHYKTLESLSLYLIHTLRITRLPYNNNRKPTACIIVPLYLSGIKLLIKTNQPPARSKLHYNSKPIYLPLIYRKNNKT
jgi:hypothetical protein